jgi:hypothetical protein
MQTRLRTRSASRYALVSIMSVISFMGTALYAEQPLPPCHPNPLAPRIG